VVTPLNNLFLSFLLYHSNRDGYSSVILGLFLFLLFLWIILPKKSTQKKTNIQKKGTDFDAGEYLSKIDFDKGWEKAEIGDHKTAIEFYNQAIEKKPKATYYNNRAFSKSKINDYSGAIADYNVSIRLDPKNSLYFANRGTVHFNNKYKVLACKDWETASLLGSVKAKELLENYCKFNHQDSVLHGSNSKEETKVFITNANAKNIVYKMNFNFDFKEEIYKLDFKWFNNYEVNNLLAFKLLFKNSYDFFQIYKKQKPIDTKEFIFEGQSPSYHNNINCERLNSSFINFKIPEEIKKRGDKAVEEFRVWFKENMYLMEGNMDFFLDRMRWKFGLSEKPKVVDYKNSGVDHVDNLDLTTLESRIDLLIFGANLFYSKSTNHKIVLDNYGKNSFIWKEKKKPINNITGLSNEFIWQILMEFELNYKNRISAFLKEYYKVKYNPELKFEGYLLEQLGFRPCHNCYSNKFVLENKNKVNRNLTDNNYPFFENTDDLPF